MRESILRLRPLTWPFLTGAVAGGAAVLFGGGGMFWGVVAFALAAALIAQFITFQEPVLRPAERTPDDPLACCRR